MIKKMEIKNISFYYGEKKILNSISFDIEKGKLYCIIGPNGSGKTTIIKLLSNQLNLKKGLILFDGKNLNDYSKKSFAKKVATVHQNAKIDVDFLNEEIVMMGRIPYLNPFKKECFEDKAKVREAMNKTGTYILKDKIFEKISGGEKQRIITAKALAQETSMLLLDEPISQLDIKYQILFMNFLKKLIKKEKYTILLVLHDLNIASQYSDELIFLNKGNLIIKGSPEKVLKEKLLKKIYGLKITIIKNPKTLKPFILYANLNSNKKEN